MADYKHVRLEAILWAKIDHLKGAKSFSGYIGSMLKYFEITGINPDSLQAPLAQETKNGIERIVRITKAVEKEQLNRMNFLEEKLNKMLYLLENLHQEPQDIVEGISESQLIEVANLNEELKQRVDKLQNEREALLEKNRALKGELSQLQRNADVQVDTDELQQIAQWFEDLEPKNMFSKDISLTKESLVNISKRIKNSIKYVR